MSKPIAFVNHVGQTIVADQVSDDKNTITVKNPAILHVTPSQTGQLQVQLIPLFFKEFVEEKKREEGIQFTYQRSQIVSTNVELDQRLVDQYARIFLPAKPVNEAPAGGNAPVIKLFDE